MKGQKKNIGVFYPVYFGCIVLFCALLAAGLWVLNSYLTAFEASQPIHGAEDMFQKYFSGEDYVLALTDSGYKVNSFETLETASDALVATKEGKEVTFYAAAGAEGEAVYNVVFVSPESEKEAEETETDGGEGDIFHDGLMGKEIEVLEDHPHFLTDEIDIRLRVIDHLPVDIDLALRRHFEHVQAADQGAFA